MPIRTQHAPGVPSWIELATPDLDAGAAFYRSLFGWDTRAVDTGGSDMSYLLATQGGKAVAGMTRLPRELQSSGVPPLWRMYVTVADVDTSSRNAAELGGNVLGEPVDALTAGRMSVVADPAGAVVCLWQPKDSIGAELVNEPNSFVWDQLATTDVETAKQFYGALFGWNAEAFDTPPGAPAYIVWQLDGQHNAMGGATSPPDDGAPPHWGIVIAVADCDQTVAAARQFGATVAAEPADIPGIGRSAKLLDPQGAAFRVMKMANEQQ